MVFKKGHSYPRAFITFEGVDGVGKTTQVDLLSDALIKEGLDVLKVKEPGSTFYGEKLRTILKDCPWPMCEETELLLMNASRAQLVREVIIPALKRGSIILCDRYADSSVAYQSFGRGLPLDKVYLINRFATGSLEPDLTFLLDAPEKQENISRVIDRIDNGDQNFRKKVLEGYDFLARIHSSRIVRIPYSSNEPDKTHREILNHFFKMISC